MEQVAKCASGKQAGVKLTMVEHRERGRVSRILHDGLQQHLAIAKLHLSLITGQLDHETLKHAVGEIEELIGESIQMSRSLSAELSPPILHRGGLSDGLKWLVSWMREEHGISVDLDIKDKPELPEDVKILVFESIRELLFNAVKHAGVSTACVGMHQIDAESVCIRVSDEGTGFDPDGLTATGDACGGLGLFGISERLGSLGGQLRIESTPGRGCCLTLTVPVRPLPPERIAATSQSASPAAAMVKGLA